MSLGETPLQHVESLEGRLSVLETHMTRLVGDDGDSGLIGRIEKHLSKMEKYVVIGMMALFIDSGSHMLTSKSLLDILKEFIK